MMNVRTGRITTIVLSLFILFTLFFGYTYYADAEALQQITAEVSSIEQIFPKFTSAMITFSLNITNPSTRDVNQLSSTFDLFIEQNYIGTGSFHNISIPAESNRFEQVTMTVYYQSLANSAVDILKNWFSGQNTTIKVEGTMTASVLFGLATASHEYIARNN